MRTHGDNSLFIRIRLGTRNKKKDRLKCFPGLGAVCSAGHRSVFPRASYYYRGSCPRVRSILLMNHMLESTAILLGGIGHNHGRLEETRRLGIKYRQIIGKETCTCSLTPCASWKLRCNEVRDRQSALNYLGITKYSNMPFIKSRKKSPCENS